MAAMPELNAPLCDTRVECSKTLFSIVTSVYGGGSGFHHVPYVKNRSIVAQL